MSAANTPISSRSGRGRFQPTRWSVVLAAGSETAGSGRRAAIDELARNYWPPLYAYLRRDGHSPERAEDLIQGFFTRLIEKNDLRAIDRSKGKFRSFVLVALKHYVFNERDKENAIKRGGAVKVIQLDRDNTETRYGPRIADRTTPEDVFNRQWALTIIENAVVLLRREYGQKGRLVLFESLQATLTGDIQAGYATIARKLGTTEGAVQVAAHRLRKRYREVLRQEVAQTVSDPSLVDEEMNDLLNSL